MRAQPAAIRASAFGLPSSLGTSSFVIWGSRMRRPIVRAVLVAFAATAVVFGVLHLGRLARDQLDQQRHYTVAFADLRCDVPPGLDRAAFLGEVQYLGGLPDQINLLEPK